MLHPPTQASPRAAQRPCRPQGAPLAAIQSVLQHKAGHAQAQPWGPGSWEGKAGEADGGQGRMRPGAEMRGGSGLAHMQTCLVSPPLVWLLLLGCELDPARQG